jgi:hypothetical protein
MQLLIEPVVSKEKQISIGPPGTGDTHTYITKHIDFSTNVGELCDWVKNVGGTGGGDGDECYELVLQEVQSLSWMPGSKRRPLT